MCQEPTSGDSRGLLGGLVSLTSLIRLSQDALDESEQLVQRLEMRGAAGYDVFHASAERIVRPHRLAGELHDEGVVRGEPAALWSVRFQVMPSRGIGRLTALIPRRMLPVGDWSPEISRRFF